MRLSCNPQFRFTMLDWLLISEINCVVVLTCVIALKDAILSLAIQSDNLPDLKHHDVHEAIR